MDSWSHLVRGRQRHPLVLELDLSQPLLEEPPVTPQEHWQARRRLVFPSLLRALKDASGDPRVVGLVAKVAPRRMGFARAQELRDAIKSFRGSGKRAVAWCETFGEMAPATVAYYIASAFDEIWVQPSGEVGLTGLGAGSFFFAEALERAGVRAQFEARHEYKNAANIFTQRGFTEAHHEAVERVVQSLWQQVVGDVAEARSLPSEGLRLLTEDAPVAAGDARSAGLVDRVGYRDEVYSAVLGGEGGVDPRPRPPKGGEAPGAGQGGPGGALAAKPQLLYVQRYHRHETIGGRVSKLAARHPSVVAVVTGSGTIRLGRSSRGALAGMGSDSVCAALRAAARDPRAKAVVFRVNSPGGSYVASDAIWREVRRLREGGKPVVVSMGDVAASGGYFVAAPADVIVAEPGTITGSIGVLGGKLSAGDVLERLGIGLGTVQEGRRARMMSAVSPFSEDELAALSHWLDRVYDDFVAKVAAGRSMSTEAVHEVAKGRVWTGADALERGLVDVLGGLERAAEIARERAGLGTKAELVHYPHVPLPARMRPPRSSEDPQSASMGLGGWGNLTELAARLGLPAGGPLLMQPLLRDLPRRA